VTKAGSGGLIPGLHGPTGVLLLLLSIGVTTITIDRCRYWLLWWRHRSEARGRWERLLREGDPAQGQLIIDDLDSEMRVGESLLQAAAVIGPLLGLIGTVLGLMQVLASLGPQLVLPAGANLNGYGRILISTALGLIISLIATLALHANLSLREWQLERLRRLQRRRSLPTAP